MATFGKTDVGATDAAFPSANSKSACKFTLSEAGYVTKLTIYYQSAGGHEGGNAKGLIYSVDESGEPDALIAVTEEVAVPYSIFDWVEFPFSSPVYLEAGDYYLGAHSANRLVSKAATTGTNRYNSDTYSDGASDPFGSASSSSLQKSVYATYYTTYPPGEGEGKTVATTTVDTGTRLPTQQKVFYAKGLLWAFYHDGTNIVYRTSDDDGDTWSSATTLFALNVAAYFSLTVEDSGDYIHYARCGADAHNLYYRKGQLNTDGTISWVESEQTIISDNSYVTDQVIVLDSNGYPWIGYSGLYNYPDNCPMVVASTTKDGTWTTKDGYPLQLDSNAALTTIVPLDNGRVYSLWHDWIEENYIYGKLYDGSSWGSLEQCSTSNASAANFTMFCATSIGDDVHLVFLSSSNNVTYVKRAYGVGWGSEETVKSSVGSRSTPVITTDGSKLYVVWCFGDLIYYRIKDGDSWEDVVEWIYEGSGFPINDCLSTQPKAMNQRMCFLYETGTESPYNVRFSYITLEEEGATYTKTWQTDVLFKKLGVTKSLGADAAFQKRDIQLTADMDALFKKLGITKSLAADAAFQKRDIQLTADADVLFKRLDVEKTANIDALLQKLNVTKTADIDVLLKALGIEKTADIDTLFQKLDVTKTADIDVLLKALGIQKTAQVDALFKKLDLLESFGVDVAYLKRDVIRSFGVDARFGALVTEEISRQIDVLFKRLDATKTFGLDVYFGPVEAEAYAKNFALDVIFAYKVRLPELWFDENGKMVLNISKPYTWVGT